MAKSAIARGASMAADVWGKLDTKVKGKGGTEDALHVLAKEEGDAILDVIADLLVKAELKTRDRFPVTVDYTKSFTEMVKSGKYDYVNDNITQKNFQITGEGQVEIEILPIHFGRDIETDAALKELEQMGLRPATLAEQLAFGAKYPDVQREYPLVCLGSSWVGPYGNRYFPYLDYWRSGRRLNLHWYDHSWTGRCRFLAVRK